MATPFFYVSAADITIILAWLLIMMLLELCIICKITTSNTNITLNRV